MRNVFTYFMLFFIYAILGWIIETTLVSIEKRKFVNRGFLIGPYCPIYGFGGLAITILLKNYTKDPIVLFLNGSNNMWNIRVFYKLHNGKNI